MNLNISFPVDTSGYGFPKMNMSSKTAYRENLKNVFLTLPNQRLVNTQVGSNMRFILFETGSDAELKEKLMAEVRRVFDAYFSELTLLSIDVETQEDKQTIDFNTVVVKIAYAPSNIMAQQDVIVFTLKGTSQFTDRSTLDPKYIEQRREQRELKNL